MFSLKCIEKQLVLLCFRSNMLKKHWVYCVFAQKGWKTIGFIACSLKSIEKALVLPCFRSKRSKKKWFYCKISVKMQKSKKKPLVLLWKMLQKSKNQLFYIVFLRVVKPISSNGFGPWPSHTRLEMLWGTLTDKLFRE